MYRRYTSTAAVNTAVMKAVGGNTEVAVVVYMQAVYKSYGYYNQTTYALEVEKTNEKKRLTVTVEGLCGIGVIVCVNGEGMG